MFSFMKQWRRCLDSCKVREVFSLMQYRGSFYPHAKNEDNAQSHIRKGSAQLMQQWRQCLASCKVRAVFRLMRYGGSSQPYVRNGENAQSHVRKGNVQPYAIVEAVLSIMQGKGSVQAYAIWRNVLSLLRGIEIMLSSRQGRQCLALCNDEGSAQPYARGAMLKCEREKYFLSRNVCICRLLSV